jgi:PAS domain-containing protein
MRGRGRLLAPPNLRAPQCDDGHLPEVVGTTKPPAGSPLACGVVPQQPMELILLRQVAGHLATPMFLVDNEGKLLYFNEPAAELLGLRYEETGAMPLEQWATSFTPTDSLGRPLPADELPLAVALSARTPCHGSIWIVGCDGVGRHLAITAIPLQGEGGANLGAVALFWALPGR